MIVVVPLPIIRTFKFPYNWSEITHCKKVGTQPSWSYDWKWIRLSRRSANGKRVLARLELILYFEN